MPTSGCWRRESESNRRIIALQAMALPLGYPAPFIVPDKPQRFADLLPERHVPFVFKDLAKGMPYFGPIWAQRGVRCAPHGHKLLNLKPSAAKREVCLGAVTVSAY